MSLISSSVDQFQPIGIDLSCLLNEEDLLLQTPNQYEIDNNKINSISSNYSLNDIENNLNLPELNQDLIIEIFNNNELNSLLDQDTELDFILNDIPNPNSNYNYLNSPSNEITCDLNKLLNQKSNLDVSSSLSPSASTIVHSPIYMDMDETSYQSSSNESFTLSKSIKKSSSSSSSNVKRLTDKRESNKQAALRYRNKKLKERDELFNECERYAVKNDLMKKKIDDIQTEISFIKSLLVDALIAKKNK
jgi:hypothetical protein